MIEPSMAAIAVPTNILAKVASGISATLIKPVGAMLIAFLPDALKEKYLEGRLSLVELKTREDIFEKAGRAMSRHMENRYTKLLNAKTSASILKYQSEIEYVEKQIRYLSTLKSCVKHLGQADGGAIGLADAPPVEDTSANTSPTWFDMFKEIAERRCEPWRRELLGKAAALELGHAEFISLKSLWHISILEGDAFEMFSVFLNSAIYLDGYPTILLDRSVLNIAIETADGKRQAMLAHVVGALVENGLISWNEVDLRSNDSIEVKTQTRRNLIVHDISSEPKPATEADDADGSVYLRFKGFHCTDIGLDLARLCTPHLNHVSDLNYDELVEIFSDLPSVKIIPK